jgi:4-amino-4-deoxy-L-arabinose transferase-like glycosyltransferase
VAGAALRLALWAWAGGGPISIWDERDYAALAVNIAERGEFALRPGVPTSIRPPLYPALVAGVYRISGLENYRAIRLLQAAISLGTVVLVYWLGRMLDSQRVGLWAAGLLVFYPSLLAYNNLLLTEVLFTALLVATCCVLVYALKRGSVAVLLAGGVLLGLAALTRSVLWLFPPVLGVYLLVVWKGPVRRRVLAALALGLAFALTVGPWAVRNTRLQETLSVVDVMGGRNFMMGNYEHTPLNRSWATIGIQGERSWVEVLNDRYPSPTPRTQGQLDKLAQREAIRFVLGHPWLTFKRDVVKFFNFWGLERELVAGVAQGNFDRVSAPVLGLLALLVFGSYAAAMLLGIFGAVAWPSGDWRSLGLLLLLIAFVCGLHTLAFGHSRYHLPLMPPVLVFAAVAIVHRVHIWERRRHLPFALACVLGGILLAAWAVEVLVVDLDRFVAALRGAA